MERDSQRRGRERERNEDRERERDGRTEGGGLLIVALYVPVSGLGENWKNCTAFLRGQSFSVSKKYGC